jgi:hypothetical protein
VLGFSSDGQWIAFVTARDGRRVPVTGGAAYRPQRRAVLQIDAVGTDRCVVTLGDRSLAMMEATAEGHRRACYRRRQFRDRANQVLPDGCAGRY